MTKLAIGYHGTTLEVAEKIVNGSTSFDTSVGRGNWLGTGVYFFEAAPYRARFWAKQKCVGTSSIPAVISAEIALDGCIDLFDIPAFSDLKHKIAEFESYERRAGLAQVEQPGLCVENGNVFTTASRETDPRVRPPVDNFRDRAFIDWYVELLRGRGGEPRSIRGIFLNGKALFPTSFLFAWAHVQIAVLDLRALTNLSIWSVQESP